MKANTKDAKIVPMVKMPLLGSVVPTFTHKNLRVLESLVGKIFASFVFAFMVGSSVTRSYPASACRSRG